MSQLENLMKLGMSEAEARQVLEDDKKIDRGEKMPFDLTAAQEKEVKKYRQADRKPFVPNLKPRERKPNEDKRFIIDKIIECILCDVDNCEGNITINIENPERQIDFTYHNVHYRIVLSAPRK